VTFVPAKALLSDIAKASAQDHGIALKTYLSAPGYSATVVRRTRAGSAEVHRNVSDVWYVIDGGGTLVTGGALVGGRETEPGELRGQTVSGGNSRRIARGDLIGIPAGIPHWVSSIDGAQLVYLVIKIKALERSRRQSQ
jgi:mannose-6-phosphate isomerase-like protein (cupin superfamily)